MSVSSDVALKKIGSIIREIEENKNGEIERLTSENGRLEKELVESTSRCDSFVKRFKEFESELFRVNGEMTHLREASETARSLSPRFVCEYMGFPVTWTELALETGPNNLKPLETQSVPPNAIRSFKQLKKRKVISKESKA